MRQLVNDPIPARLWRNVRKRFSVTEPQPTHFVAGGTSRTTAGSGGASAASMRITSSVLLRPFATCQNRC